MIIVTTMFCLLRQYLLALCYSSLYGLSRHRIHRRNKFLVNSGLLVWRIFFLCHNIPSLVHPSLYRDKEFVCRDINQLFFFHDFCLSFIMKYFHCCDNVLFPFSLFFVAIELQHVAINFFCLLTCFVSRHKFGMLR